MTMPHARTRSSDRPPSRRRIGALLAVVVAVALPHVGSSATAADMIDVDVSDAPVVGGISGWWTEAEALAAATRVDGPIREDTTWTAVGGPYLVDSAIEVRSTATLTVEAGTSVLLSDGGELRVLGHVDLVGTRADPVLVRGIGSGPGLPGHARLLTTPTNPGPTPMVTLDHVLVENTYSTVSLDSGFVSMHDTRFIGPVRPTYSYGVSRISPSGFTDEPLLDHVEMSSQPYLQLPARNLRVTDSRFRARSDETGSLLTVWAGASITNSSFTASATGSVVCACYDLGGSAPDDLDLRENYWHTTDDSEIERLIVDHDDYESLDGTIAYRPWLAAEPTGALFPPALMSSPTTRTSGPGAVTVSWLPAASDGGSPVTGYRLRTWSGESLLSERELPSGRPETIVDRLTPGVGYRFSVQSLNALGASAWSWASPTTVVLDRPAPPAQVSVARGDGEASVTWQAPPDNGGAPVTSYVVSRSPGRVAGEPSTTVVPTSDPLRLRVPDLVNGSTYSFTVAASNEVGTSEPSTAAAVVPAGVPRPVARPVAAVSGQRVVLRWKPANPNGSPLLRYEVSGGARPSRTSPGVRTLSFKRMRPGRYSFRVRSVNAVGASALSPPLQVRVRR